MNSGFFLLTLFSCSAIVFFVFSALLAHRSGRSAEAEPYLWWSAGLLAEAARYGLAASAWRIEPSWHAFPANALWPVSAFLLLAGVLRHGGKPPVTYKVLAGCLVAAGWGLGAQLVPVSSRLAAAPLVLAGSAALFYGGGLMLLRAAGNREVRGWVLGGCLVAIGGARLVTPLAGEGAAALGWENALMLVLGSAFATALLWPGPRGKAAGQGGGAAEERVFTEILDALPIPAVIVRFSDGEILFANPLAGKLFGTTREQVIGQKDVDFYLNPEDLKEVSRKVVRDGRLMEHPLSMRRQDGTPVFVRISVVAIAFRGQRAAITCVYDVTDLKTAEDEARTAETRMRMVLANAPIILYALDADGIFTLSEGRELASVGREPGEVVGQSAFEVFKHLPDRIAQLRRGLAGEAFTAELNVDGVWFRALHEPMLDENGAVAGLTVLSTNISKGRKAEEESERMAAVVEQTADVIIITDTEGIVTYANPAFEKASGYGREEAIGQKTRFLNSGVHDDAFYRHLWTTLKKGEAWTGHFTNRKKDGALFEVDSTISPLRDAAGEVTHYIALGKEVTEQYRLEEQLRQAQRMEIVGNMAGAIAHDFNNLLLPITGYTQLLQETIPADSQQGKDLAMVLSGATRAKELINQILLFSTQQEGRREAIHLEPVVEEVLGFLRPTLAASITIREKFPSEPAVVLADHTLVHQILTNLCLNAAQAMPDGGELCVELDHVQVRDQKDHLGNLFSGDFVRISVADQGIGMDEATRLNIFAPFFTTKGQGKGTGLGLATVLRIVQISEGHITVETAPGKGARFDVYLRRSDGESAEKTPAPPEIIGGNETILFVDDEEVIVTLAKRTLEGMGYQVTGVTESGQAISLFEAEPKKFDLVVTDLKMPNVGGEELAKAIKRTREDVPILLCTGFMESITPQWARRVGFCGVLLKPFRVEELGRRVRLAIDGAATGGQETAATK